MTANQIDAFLTTYRLAEHLENPTKVPASNPNILLFASVAAVYAKSLFKE